MIENDESQQLISPEERANRLAAARRGQELAVVEQDDLAAIGMGKNFANPSAEFPEFDDILQAVSDRFVELTATVSPQELKSEQRYYQLVNEVVNTRWAGLVRPVDLERLVTLLRAYQFGYGMLEDYMLLPDLEEIYFNRYDQGFFIIAGEKRRFSQQVFTSNNHLVNFVRKIATENDVSINSQKPNVDATLRDGSRLNATLEPLAVDGADFVIRRHRNNPFTIEEMLERQVMTPELAEKIGLWIQQGLNIVVSGGTSSGKTSLLNTLGNTFIPPEDRLIVVENRKELQIQTEDCKYFQTKEDATKPNEETDITVRDLIRQILRKRPDRIIVGEVRGGEAFDAMTAWNSGHDGSMCTIHANSAWECLSRLEQLCGFSAVRPSESSVRALISESVDIVIHMSRDRHSAQRQVVEVIQVLHPNKHDYMNPEVVSWVEELKENNLIQRQRPGADDIYIVPLYTRDNHGQLNKVVDRVPLRGRD
jgi:Flp pilus assembly CpaF family ATPase